MQAAIRILGVDPGLRSTGWGIVTVSGNALSFVAAGTVKAPLDGELAQRLVALHRGLAEIVRSWKPDEAAVEQTFVNRDASATLKLGQARGIALLVPAAAGLSVAEYAPNAVKKAIVGTGHAEKGQIRAMVRVLLPRATFDSDDAADALAIAICHAHHRQAATRRPAAGEGELVRGQTAGRRLPEKTRGEKILDAIRGTRTANKDLSTDQIMKLLRGDD